MSSSSVTSLALSMASSFFSLNTTSNNSYRLTLSLSISIISFAHRTFSHSRRITEHFFTSITCFDVGEEFLASVCYIKFLQICIPSLQYKNQSVAVVNRYIISDLCFCFNFHRYYRFFFILFPDLLFQY